MSQQTETVQSYLTFRVAGEHFAGNVSKVLEILEVPKITKVPKSPDFMRGVINLRGTVLPVIDTRIKFGFPPAPDTINTCIIVISVAKEGKELVLGVVVDSVTEVREIESSSIQPPPSIGSRYRTEFIEGMMKFDDQFIMILDIDLVFTAEEVSLLRDLSEVAEEVARNKEADGTGVAKAPNDSKKKPTNRK